MGIRDTINPIPLYNIQDPLEPMVDVGKFHIIGTIERGFMLKKWD
jgi:hypothetical protein